LILLIIPSMTPFESRIVRPEEDAFEMAPQHLREFLERYQFDRIAELIHLVRCYSACHGL